MTSYLRPNMQSRETEFLEVRQRIKESIRKKMQNGNDIASTSDQINRKLPYNDFGSFFGPSETVIATRVLQESKSLLENEKLTTNKKSSVPVNNSETKNPNEIIKIKAEKLKDSRDYSFLFSDDAELPVSRTNGQESSQRQAPKRKLDSEPMDHRKKMCLNSNGVGHSSKISASQRPNSKPSPKKSQMDNSRPVSSGSKMQPGTGLSTNGKAKTKEFSAMKPRQDSQRGTSSSKGLTCVPRKESVEQRKVSQELKSSQMVPRKPPTLLPSKDKPTLMKEQQPRRKLENKKKKKASRMSEDDVLALQMVREMCKTDRYSGRDFDDYDDRNMEANFEDILKEEKRSARIARKEDAEQKKLIEEEERRERLSKKKQKLTH